MKNPVEQHRDVLNQTLDFVVDSIAPKLIEKINSGEALNKNEVELNRVLINLRSDIARIFHAHNFPIYGGQMRKFEENFLFEHITSVIKRNVLLFSQMLDNIQHLSDKFRRKYEPFLEKTNGKELLLVDTSILAALHDNGEDKAKKVIKATKIPENQKEAKMAYRDIYKQVFTQIAKIINRELYSYKETYEKDRRTGLFKSTKNITHKKPLQSHLEYAKTIANSKQPYEQPVKTADNLHNLETHYPKEKTEIYHHTGATNLADAYQFLPPAIRHKIEEANPYIPELIKEPQRLIL